MVESNEATVDLATVPGEVVTGPSHPYWQTSEEVVAHEILIRPRKGWVGIDWQEMFAYRELLFFFVWRDITARYKQTVLGNAWAILQPMILMGIFTFISRFAKIPLPPGIPTPVFIFAGLIPWSLFSQGMPGSGLSLVNSHSMLTKVYFPRLFLPISAAAVYLVDLTYSLLLFAVILLLYGVVPSWTCIFLPFLVVLTLIATLSIGITLSGLTLFYRDFRHVTPFLVQIMMYGSPVFFPTTIVPLRFRPVVALNPMFGIIDAYRSAILGLPLDYLSFGISTLSAIFFFVFGVLYFRKAERFFADFA